MPGDRYEDLLAASPMVKGSTNSTRIAADKDGVLWYSQKGADFARITPIDPVLTAAGQLTFGAVVTQKNLVAWFKGDSLSSSSSLIPGAAITTWTDQSGLGSRDLTAVGSPLYIPNAINGRPGVRTEPNTPSYFQNAATNLITTDRGARTVFAVAIGRNTTVGGAFMQFRIGATNLFIMEHRFSGGFLVYGGMPTGTQQGNPPGPAVLSTPHIFEYSYDARITGVATPLPVAATDSVIRVMVDGVSYPIMAVGASGAESGTTGFAVGTRTDATTVGWNGDICEILVFSEDLPFKSRRLIRNYLAAKYAIPVVNATSVQWLGDSHLYGQGDASTVLSGGPRMELHSLHPQLASKGSAYTPNNALNGVYNYTDGYQAATSATSGAAFIGGVNLNELMRPTKPDVVFLMIGTNDPLTAITDPAVTAANVLNIVNQIGAISPDTKVVVCRAPELATAHISAGTANPIIRAQGGELRKALTPTAAPNVLVSAAYGNVIILPTIADSFYVGGDNVHLTPAGWHEMIRLAIDPFLRSVGI